jgi:preprotein translocase subunit SecB
MFAPIQMHSFDVLESRFTVNPKYDGTQQELTPLLYVMGDFVAPEDVDPDAVENPLRLNVATEFSEQGRPSEDFDEGSELFNLFLSLHINDFGEDPPGQIPFEIELLTVANFVARSVPDESETEERRRVLNIIHVNAVSMMYGSARTIVRHMTDSGIHPSLLIPSLNFQQVIEREKNIEASIEGDIHSPKPEE